MEARFIKLCREHKFCLGSFFMLALYNFIFAMGFYINTVSGVEYSFHIVDYSMGFCTKFLPGAVCRLFLGSDPSPETVTVYYIVELIITWFFISVLIEKFILSAPIGFRKDYIILSLFYLTGPCTFSIFAYCLGMLDFSWIPISVIFMFMLGSKKAKWGLPLLFVAALLVHFSCMISFEVLFALLILYKWCYTEDHRERKQWGILFLCSIVVAGVAFFYFLLFEKNNLVYSMEEFDALMKAKGGTGYYFDYALYDSFDYFDGSKYLQKIYAPISFSAVAEKFVNKLVGQVLFNYKAALYLGSTTSPLSAFVLPLLCAPLLAIVYKYVFRELKANKGNVKKRFFWFFMIIMYPFTLVSSMLTSVDMVRWSAYAFICFFTLFLFIVYERKRQCAEYVHCCFSEINPLLWFIYYCVYAITVFSPY